jgi:hypothetical protein
MKFLAIIKNKIADDIIIWKLILIVNIVGHLYI